MTASSREIKFCVIGSSSRAFTAHITSIRKIEGVKVIKRRNKPFYDVSGNIDAAAFKDVGISLALLMDECGAQLEIPDEQTKTELLAIIKPIIEG